MNTNIDFPLLPRIDELHSWYSGDPFRDIALFKDMRISHPARPTEPNKQVKSAQDAIDLHIARSQYKLNQIEYDIVIAAVREHNSKVDELLKAVICYHANLESVPEQYRDKVYAKAWQDGHSGGYSEVFCELCNLVDIFN